MERARRQLAIVYALRAATVEVTMLQKCLKAYEDVEAQLN